MQSSPLVLSSLSSSKRGSESVDTLLGLDDSSDSCTQTTEETDPLQSPCVREQKQHAHAPLDDEEENEPLCTEQPDRNYVLRPSAKYAPVWKMHKKQEACFWVAASIDQSQDAADWRTKLNDDERHFLSHVLAFFASADGIVAENLISRFQNEVKVQEVEVFYAFQAMMENIHAEVYFNLIENMITSDEAEVNRLCDAVHTMPCIRDKAYWAKSYIECDRPFAHRLVAFAIVEGLFFSGSFCAIFWIRKRGILNGLCQSNQYISRDEGLHTDFACLLYTQYINPRNRLSTEAMVEMMQEAVRIEKAFICDALPVSMIGMNATLMAQYVELVADRLLVALGEEPIYKVTNPFPWMEMISQEGKTNFFEHRVTEYQISGVMDAFQNRGAVKRFSMDEEF